MYRSINKHLLNWKQSKIRKPLLLRGARQVGKTWAARHLGRTFESCVEINLEKQPELEQLFNENFGNPKVLIDQFNLILNVKIEAGKTLLFLDEIQENKNALMSLRYFYEEMPELHVIAAGSLVEFALKEISFPVGRIQFQYIFPLNFSEYLIAIGREDLLSAIQKLKTTPISDLVHEKINEELKKYLFIGGMPEVIQTYIDQKDMRLCSQIQNDLINNFRQDFNKYASRSRIPHMKLVFDSVPRYFSQKFKYVNVAEDVKSRELGEALQLLCEAGLAYKCYQSASNGVPLSAEIDTKKFKVYFLDIGLALKMLGTKPSEIIKLSFDKLLNKGGLAEQFVCQEMISLTENGNNPGTYYWHRDALNSSAEIDFVTSVDENVVPIEVKSGPSRNSKSLSLFCHEKKLETALMVSQNQFKKTKTKEYKLIQIPFYGLVKDISYWLGSN